MNLLQCAPLCDSHGKVRYFIGAQVDVSGLAMEGAQMESLQNLTAQKESKGTEEPWKQSKSEFQELGELFSPRELQNVHAYGGNLFQPIEERINPTNSRLFIPGSPDHEAEKRLSEAQLPKPSAGLSGSLTGVYQHVCSFNFKKSKRDCVANWNSTCLFDHIHLFAFFLLLLRCRFLVCFSPHSCQGLEILVRRGIVSCMQ